METGPAPAPVTAPEPAAEPSASAWDYLDQGTGGAGAGSVADVADLAALGLPAEEEATRFPRLDLYGFADLTYWHPLMGKDSPWAFYFPSKSTFWVGNINLYVASQMSKVLRSLIEVRFTYLPQGKNRSGLEPQGQPYVDSSAQDYADAERPLKLGAIEIERVQLEYAPVGWLSIVAGQWLTPYGIWNVDHGSPTTIMAQKPYIVGEQYIPERQTGLLLGGAVRAGVHRFGYNLGLSNGRGPLDSYYDMDNNKAVTARLSWQSTSLLGDLTLGSSGYLGRYTDSQRQLLVTPAKAGSLELTTKDEISTQFDEYSLAADAKLVNGGLQIFSEVVMNTRKYTRQGRPSLQGGLLDLIAPQTEPRLQPDVRRWGGYLTAGYRLQWLGVMPFVHLEYVRLNNPDMPVSASAAAGFNIRPHESTTLKLHYGVAWFPDADSRGPGRGNIEVLEAQVAWAF